jgi:peptide/nickel transport system permease protein
MIETRMSGKIVEFFRGNTKALYGGMILFIFAMVAFIGPFFVGDPTDYIGVPLSPPSAEHWFGTNGQGQDVLAQTVAGAQKTLVLSFAVGAIVTLIGVTFGISAGFLGGYMDDFLSLLTNMFLVIPGLPLAIVLAAFLPPGGITLGFVLVITGWAWNARVLRSQTLTIKSKDFVKASIVAGESSYKIVFFEILPNMLSLIVSVFIGSTIYALGAQVGLEFLGLGNMNEITWGTNLYWASNDSALLTKSWWTFVPTGLSIALVGFALSLLNFAVDEVTDPSFKAERIFRKRLAHQPMVSQYSTPVVKNL